jgi:hypothetical protein
MKSLRLILAALFALLFLWELGRPHHYRDASVDPVVDSDRSDFQVITVDQAAEVVRSDDGTKRVVYLYDEACVATSSRTLSALRASGATAA